MKKVTFKQLEKARAKRRKENPKLDPNNVRKVMCSSCPFNEYGKAIGSEFDIETFNQLQTNLTIQCLTEFNQYCHKDELEGKVSNHVCRGARNIQLKYFYQLGVIESPTDESWSKALKQSI